MRREARGGEEGFGIYYRYLREGAGGMASTYQCPFFQSQENDSFFVDRELVSQVPENFWLYFNTSLPSFLNI